MFFNFETGLFYKKLRDEPSSSFMLPSESDINILFGKYYVIIVIGKSFMNLKKNILIHCYKNSKK